MSYEDQSHRFVITGEDPEGRPRTIILWRETDLVHGKVVRRVVTLDATIRTATSLTQRGGRRGGGGDPGGGAVSTEPAMDPWPVMHREKKRSRLVVDGKRTDNGERCSLVVVHEVGGIWAWYPHSAAQLGVRLPRSCSGCPKRPLP